MPGGTSKGVVRSGSRTRVSVFLPAQGDPDAKAVARALGYFEQLRGGPLPIGGFTASRVTPSVFTGFWYDDTATPPTWCREAVVNVIFDLEADLDDRSLTQMLGRMRTKLAKIYDECGSAQKEFWIMAHPVVQYLSA